ncbi:MAG: phosphoribosylformylglycinamidine synthase [Eubacteriales bacterium]|nr:phosphoribosylformylglycinamidine synthase [Eubacteriales bacterium]
MNKTVRRIYVEKKPGFDVEAKSLYRDLKYNLGIKKLEKVRTINRYDIQGISENEYKRAVDIVFAEPPADFVYHDDIDIDKADGYFAVEYLPGQYDQRADSAAQCVQILTGGEKPVILTAKVIALYGNISDKQLEIVKKYCINPVESREASFEKPGSLEPDVFIPASIKTEHGFTQMDDARLSRFLDKMGFAMSFEDLKFCRQYFRDEEKRDPTVTELKVLDTYWSDHCRHTTFLTGLENIEIEDGKYTAPIKESYLEYIKARKFLYEGRSRDITLMDIATTAMKEFRKKGLLDDLEISDEINACSIIVKADADGKQEDWLVMFKNETHNHPTEIEPFGGAATCLGGAIRDPLSGRSYVYQAMRVTGSGDPRAKVEDTIPGKLPQRKITTGAAAGYSSYGNQIGLSTGLVDEIYDDGYIAKRMEIGVVLGAAPRRNVFRGVPEPGDTVVLLGGRTGRDGCGGATGSSKEHTRESLMTCGAEVQKGNPVTERKIQRLFRNPKVSRMIVRCNDFGAGGVSVAIGELADGLSIDLDSVPKKYEGLDGTELAISESQERMAVLLREKDVRSFIAEAAAENLEATKVAEVIRKKRLIMTWNKKTIVDISRDFLNTNGAKQHADIKVAAPGKTDFFEKNLSPENIDKIEELWLNSLGRLDTCSRKGLAERFDSTIGAASVLMPFGGKYQLSPAEGMAAKLPMAGKETNTATLTAHGFNPEIAKWSPFHGAVYAVVEAAAKIAAMGGDYSRLRLTLQEYFEKPRNEPERWGKPFSALLGAYYAQKKFGIPAIGGKDSMSGSFMDMDVPPTLVAFAVGITDADKVISAEFKKINSPVIITETVRGEDSLPDFDELKKIYSRINKLAKEGKILSASSIRAGGAAAAISRMCFGNMIGFKFDSGYDIKKIFVPSYGSIILELSENSKEEDLEGIRYRIIGSTSAEKMITVKNVPISLDKALKAWMEPLEEVFPTEPRNASNRKISIKKLLTDAGETDRASKKTARIKTAKPRVFIPVFPGTNCEYDSANAFGKAGGIPDVMVIRNLSAEDIKYTVETIAEKIDRAQIVMLPGGFSAGDEPDGSGKFIAAVMRNPYISEALTKLLKYRDGLMLGICNGFQALVKLGLLPFGEILPPHEDYPTLTFNTLGRHVSCMARTKIVSKLSPWLSLTKLGDIHTIPVSHGEGRFVAGAEILGKIARSGQICTQYVDLEGNPTYDARFNPNGSAEAIEGICSPDGRIFGKMAHSERIGRNVAINVPGNKDQRIFESGINYFL